MSKLLSSASVLPIWEAVLPLGDTPSDPEVRQRNDWILALLAERAEFIAMAKTLVVSVEWLTDESDEGFQHIIHQAAKGIKACLEHSEFNP